MIDKVIALVERETSEAVTAETRFDSLNIDSLDFLELILQAQNEFNITIPDATVAELNTIADLAKVIDELHVSA